MNNKNLEEYIIPDLTVIKFDGHDVITTSGFDRPDTELDEEVIYATEDTTVLEENGLI